MAYNGWTNYETWAVALWIDNEEGSYHERQRMAEDFKAAEPDEGEEPGEPDVQGFADAIKDWVEREMMPDLGSSLAADLLGAAMSEVNWREIAENWLGEE